MKTRTGYAVKITRDDGTTFLASADRGLLPAVFSNLTYAVGFKRDISTHIEKARMKVVRVSYAYPEEMPA